jgi:Cu-processing system permease protein
MLSLRTVAILAGHELRSSLRNRWFLLYAVAFAILSTALSSLSLSGAGTLGGAGFGRMSASLINLVLLMVPLMGLMVGAQSLAGERERGTLAYLLAQPVNRAEVLVGKLFGLGIALWGALLAGYGVSGALLAWHGSPVGAGNYAGLVGLSLLLAMASLSIGMAISAWSRSGAPAVGVALFVWLILVFLGDLGIMGTAVAMRLDIGTLLGLSFLNPLQIFKIATLNTLRSSLEILGPAGIFASRTFGDSLNPLLVGLLTAWSAIPALLTFLRFRSDGDF